MSCGSPRVALDAARFRVELGIPDDAWVVGTVGRLALEKDQALLIDAVAPLLSEGRQLVIVGDGPERGVLRARIARIPNGRYVHMLGEREDVENILAALDAFALTSRTEGLPLVLLEAMATGLPVLSTAVGGIPDLLEHRVTGLLSPTGDRTSVTSQLEFLSTDRSLSRQMGEAGQREIHLLYSVDRMAREYEVLYESTLHRSRRFGGAQCGRSGHDEKRCNASRRSTHMPRSSARFSCLRGSAFAAVTP